MLERLFTITRNKIFCSYRVDEKNMSSKEFNFKYYFNHKKKVIDVLKKYTIHFSEKKDRLLL